MEETKDTKPRVHKHSVSREVYKTGKRLKHSWTKKLSPDGFMNIIYEISKAMCEQLIENGSVYLPILQVMFYTSVCYNSKGRKDYRRLVELRYSSPEEYELYKDTLFTIKPIGRVYGFFHPESPVRLFKYRICSSLRSRVYRLAEDEQLIPWNTITQA